MVAAAIIAASVTLNKERDTCAVQADFDRFSVASSAHKSTILLMTW